MKNFLIALVLVCIASTPALAQAPQAPQVGYKDPGTATLFSVVVPGGGQIYSGETQKGLLLMGGGLAGLILGAAMTSSSAGVSCDDDFSCEDDTNYAPAALGYLTYLGTWVYGIIDADDSANRMNASRGIARALSGNVAPLVASSGGDTSVGVTIRF
jgi:hypothetical protein